MQNSGTVLGIGLCLRCFFRPLVDRSDGRVIVPASEVLRVLFRSSQLLREYDQSGVIMQSSCIARFTPALYGR